METLYTIGILQSIFATLVIFSKKDNQISDRILGFWLSFIALGLLFLYLFLKINLGHSERYKTGFIPLTYGPFLFLYAKSLTEKHFSFKPVFMWHFLPAALFFISIFLIQGVVFFFPDSLPKDEKENFQFIFLFLFVISVFVYSYIVFKLISEHENRLREYYSNITGVTLNWLKVATICFFGGYFLGIIYFVLFSFYGEVFGLDPVFFPVFLFVLFTYIFSYFGIRQSPIYNRLSIIKEKKVPINSSSNVLRYERSGLNEKNIAYILEHLEEVLVKEKIYLNRDLTIQELSEHLKVSRHYLTQTINEKLNKNFYQLINEYRVNEFIDRLKKEENQHLTLLSLAYDCGFNSKSSFNMVFKQMTGMTPSQYKRSMDHKEKHKDTEGAV